MCNDRKWLVSGICTFPACVFFSVTLLSSGFRPCPSFCVQPRQTFYIRLLFSDFLFTTLPNYHMIRWSLIWARIVLLFAKHYDIASFANVQDIVAAADASFQSCDIYGLLHPTRCRTCVCVFTTVALVAGEPTENRPHLHCIAANMCPFNISWAELKQLFSMQLLCMCMLLLNPYIRTCVPQPDDRREQKDGSYI